MLLNGRAAEQRWFLNTWNCALRGSLARNDIEQKFTEDAPGAKGHQKNRQETKNISLQRVKTKLLPMLATGGHNPGSAFAYRVKII